MDIFILGGQSNMAGRGGVFRDATGQEKWDAVLPPECQFPSGAAAPQVFRFAASEFWEPAAEPLHADIDTEKACGIGPGITFAHHILRQGAVQTGTVGLVPCAVGGTQLAEWEPGAHLYKQMDTLHNGRIWEQGSDMKELFGRSVERTRPSKQPRLIHVSVRCFGIRLQGESDADVLEKAETWNARFNNMLQAFRTSITGFASATVNASGNLLPVMQVAITCAPMEASKHAGIIRQAQLLPTAEKVLPVDAQGLELQEDGWHLTTAAQLVLGKRLADAYLTLQR